MSKLGEDYIVSAEKRALDIAGASLLAVVGAPIIGVAAAAMCIERRRVDPIFRQQRVGRNAMPFILNKLRTIDQQEAENNFDTFGSADPRASKLGRFVRRLGIDELPQVTNILAGDMSLVGIRPQVDWVLDQRQSIDPALFEDWYYCYLRNPGLFGAGQAYAHEVGGYKENGEIVRDLMKLDVTAYQSASWRTDLEAVASQPLDLVHAALRTV